MLSKWEIHRRPQEAVLKARLTEKRRFIQVVSGPRQVGKSTLVNQVANKLRMPIHYASADQPTLQSNQWIEQQWEIARLEAKDERGSVLILDEIQKIPTWSSIVKHLWDEDTRRSRHVKVVLLGSAPLLISSGLTESLAGRFEIIPLSHWSYGEMHKAFGFTLDEYIFYGGYPGAAPLIKSPQHWARYIIDSLIETSISRDVLLLTRVDKPALLRRLFDLSCRYSGQILSFTKMLGQLQDAGNSTTLAHYLSLLEAAGMVSGLSKYAGSVARSRGSSPKLQVLNMALMTALMDRPLDAVRSDPETWGRLVESAVGSYIANAALRGECRLYYWRERNQEVDFIVLTHGELTAIEVKSGRTAQIHSGLNAFQQQFKPKRSLLVGANGIPLEEFFLKPMLHWVGK